jgi:hypothetical protein
VLNNNLVDSDHLPLLVEFNFSNKTKVNEQIMSSTVKLDYNKANWSGFENDLNIVHPPLNTSIDELNRIIVESIISAKEKNIPKKKQFKGRDPLPEYIVLLIKKKKALKSKIKRHKQNENININVWKRDYNMLKILIKGELAAIENSSWNKFLEKQGKHPTSSAPFWRKIGHHKNKQSSIKSLLYNNKLYHTDGEKANLFAEILQTTFSEENNNKFDPVFKKTVEDKFYNLT